MVYSQPFLPNPDRFYGWGFLFLCVSIDGFNGNVKTIYTNKN